MANETIKFLDALGKVDRVNKAHESYMDEHILKLAYHRKYMTILVVVVTAINMGMFITWLILR